MSVAMLGPCENVRLEGDLDIDGAIGSRLRTLWAAIPQEPLPAMLVLAVASLPYETVQTDIWGQFIALVPEPVWGALLAAGGTAAVLSVYLIKSALGIDLFDGPSMLHDIFFD